MGEQLVLMANTHLEKIKLDSSLFTAIKEARRLKNLDARRRQIQYIGKLMRNMDLTEIRYSIEKLNHQSQTFRQHFAMLEQWRDRLIDEGNSAIEEFLIAYPSADRQQIRNLSRQAGREKTGSAKTKLFKYIKEMAD
jgi:ribosome-associated protein